MLQRLSCQINTYWMAVKCQVLNVGFCIYRKSTLPLDILTRFENAKGHHYGKALLFITDLKCRGDSQHTDLKNMAQYE